MKKSGWQSNGSDRPGSRTPSFTPLKIIEHERGDQHQICNAMELVADQLPDEVDRSLCKCIYEKLQCNLPVYHLNEEALYDCLSRRPPSGLQLLSVVQCVRQEHAIHNCYADELQEHLELLSAGQRLRNPDTVGYLLRFCFETIRRHLAWEDLTLMRWAEGQLARSDYAELSQILEENRKGLRLDIV